MHTQPAPAPDPTQIRLVKEWKHARPLVSCRCDPLGGLVSASAQDELIQLWNLETDAKLELGGFESWVWTIAYHAQGNLLIAGDGAGRVQGWRYLESPPSQVLAIDAHKGWVRSVAISPDGHLLASGGNDHLVRLWSMTDVAWIRDLAGHDCHVYNVAFHPQGGHLASVDQKGKIQHWDLATGAAVRQLDASVLWKYDDQFKADIGGARGMAFSHDGTLLACSGITDVTNAFAGVGNAVVVLFDWGSGEQKALLRPKENQVGVAWSVAFHESGMLVAAIGGQAGGSLWFFKPNESEPFYQFKLPAAARHMDLHPDGMRIAVACADSALRIYDMSPQAAAAAG